MQVHSLMQNRMCFFFSDTDLYREAEDCSALSIYYRKSVFESSHAPTVLKCQLLNYRSADPCINMFHF